MAIIIINNIKMVLIIWAYSISIKSSYLLHSFTIDLKKELIYLIIEIFSYQIILLPFNRLDLFSIGSIQNFILCLFIHKYFSNQ